MRLLFVMALLVDVIRLATAFHGKQTFSSTNLPKITTPASTTTTALHADDVKDMLYKEQEKLLVSRGELEGELMAHTFTPLEPNVVKGLSSGGGGFGAKGSGGKSKKAQAKAAAKSHAKVLKEQGVVRIDNVFDSAMADRIRAIVYEMRQESEELVNEGKIPSLERFANVLLKENRCDMTIPIGPTWVADALQAALLDSPIGFTVSEIMGKNAILRELSCLMSDPGSDRQVMHPDAPYQPEPVLYTCFIALQDVTIDMGPTTWIPQTHTKEMHALFKDESPSLDDENPQSPKDRLLSTKPSVLGMLPKGCCAIFDSRLLHCGGANTSDTSRAIFYCSFQNPKITQVGNPPSIRPDLVDQWTLQELQKELELYAKGKPTERLVSAE